MSTVIQPFKKHYRLNFIEKTLKELKTKEKRTKSSTNKNCKDSKF